MAFFSRFYLCAQLEHATPQPNVLPRQHCCKACAWRAQPGIRLHELGVERPDVPPSGMQAGCSTLGQRGNQGDTAYVALVKRFEGRVLYFCCCCCFKMILFCFELLISEYLKLNETHKSFSTDSSGAWLSPPLSVSRSTLLRWGRRRQKWHSVKSLKNAEILLASAFHSPVTYSSEHRCN